MSSSNLVPYAFGENLVRVLMDENGDPIFVAKDVTRALEYSSTNVTELCRHVPEEWKGSRRIATPGGEQEMLVLTEQGLYFFVARSDKPGALPFQKWLAGEVLPSIRKTGRYATPLSGGAAVPPETVKRLRPLMRERILGNAIRVASIVGATSREDVDAIFLHYCELVGYDPSAGFPAGFSGNPAAYEKELCIRRFAEDCLVHCKGNRVNVAKVYRVFCEWWRGRFDSEAPPVHGFGKVLRELYPKFKRGGIMFFNNVNFREGAPAA